MHQSGENHPRQHTRADNDLHLLHQWKNLLLRPGHRQSCRLPGKDAAFQIPQSGETHDLQFGHCLTTAFTAAADNNYRLGAVDFPSAALDFSQRNQFCNFHLPLKKNSASPIQLSDVALELIATRFRALSEPMRLRLLNTLMQGERTVGQLVEASGSGQANVSKHLAVLKDAGMVGTRKEGLSTFCYIADPMVNELCEMMCRRLRGEMEAKARALEFNPDI